MKAYSRNQMLWYLAKTKGQSISISSTYIVFVTKMQKRQIPKKRFALFESGYHNFWTGIRTL